LTRRIRGAATLARAVHRLQRYPKPVYLYAYDFTWGFCKVLSKIFVGKKFVVAGHTAIVAYGHEYYVQNSLGPAIGAPGQWGRWTRLHKLDLGMTNKSRRELDHYIANNLRPLFKDRYNLACNNCNHYADEVCRFLIDKEFPEDILKGKQHAEEVLMEHGSVVSLALCSLILPFVVLFTSALMSIIPVLILPFMAMSGVVDGTQLQLYLLIVHVIAMFGFVLAMCMAFFVLVRTRSKFVVMNAVSTVLTLVLEILTESPINTVALMAVIVSACAGATSLGTVFRECKWCKCRVSPNGEPLIKPLLALV